MSPETEKRIDLVLYALAFMQEEQKKLGVQAVPPPGEISYEYLASLSDELGEPVSKSTWHAFAALAEEKAKRTGRQLGLEHFLSPEP